MNVDELEERLSRPTAGVADVFRELPGDVLVLGAGGKMGPTLARMARRALRPGCEVIAVSRFSSPSSRAELERHGVRTMACDLLDPNAVAGLPCAENVIFMAGQKFGTSDHPEFTWMVNCVVPSIVAQRFSRSRIVVFSTGCVYPLTSATGKGSCEEDVLNPPGEYAYSCIGRERVFSHYSTKLGVPMLICRLNYAVELRYGILHDVATNVWQGLPVDVTMGFVNVIWQGDANARALQSLARTTIPPAVLNVTGRECISVRWLARQFGELFGLSPVITGSEGDLAWLSDSAKSFEWFGDVSVSLEEMIRLTADWVRSGGPSLGKPTHFETHDGTF